jgi:hypothetical protein
VRIAAEQPDREYISRRIVRLGRDPGKQRFRLMGAPSAHRPHRGGAADPRIRVAQDRLERPLVQRDQCLHADRPIEPIARSR